MSIIEEFDVVRDIINDGAPPDRKDRPAVTDVRVIELAAGLLTYAARRRFTTDTDDTDIAMYVATLPERLFNAGQTVTAPVAEALIRAALGDSEQLDKQEPLDVNRALFPVAQALAADCALTPEELDEAALSIVHATRGYRN